MTKTKSQILVKACKEGLNNLFSPLKTNCLLVSWVTCPLNIGGGCGANSGTQGHESCCWHRLSSAPTRQVHNSGGGNLYNWVFRLRCRTLKLQPFSRSTKLFIRQLRCNGKSIYLDFRCHGNQLMFMFVVAWMFTNNFFLLPNQFLK